MKRIVYTSIASLMMAIMITMNVFAKPFNPNDYTSVNDYSALLPPGANQSKVTKSLKTRGNFFMRADLIVMNNGHGKVGALAVAYTAVPVDVAYITIYLDRWIEEEERWAQVNYYDAEFYKEDYPNGLTAPTVDISFKDQPKGNYYRLRGVFGVFSGSEYESITAMTDGILLD